MNWIEAFVEYTSNTSSPEILRRWGAISCVAAALERKVWVTTAGSRLYPNLYLFFCAPAGVGKTEITWRVRTMLKELEGFHLAPSSVTKASLIDDLNEAERRIVRVTDNPAVVNFNSLMVCVNELGVLIPAYDNEFMNTLTDIYDCKQYGERRRTSKIEIQLDAPQINLLGACTPPYLNNTLPEGAWDQGFMSRTIVIFAGERIVRSLFSVQEADQEEYDTLVAHLQKVFDLYGEFEFTDEVKTLIDGWYLSGCSPSPDHPKLVGYNQRRIVHVLKLCMVSAAVRLEPLIRAEDFEQALSWLLEAEVYMPEIFKAMSAGGPGRIIEEAWHYIFTVYSKEEKPVQEHRIIQWLQERVPVHQVAQTLELMEKSKLIEQRLTVAGKAYVPKGRKAH